MTKHKIGKLFSIALMAMALIAIVIEFLGSSEYKNLNLYGYIGSFLFGVYLFYLNRKHERKMKDERKD